MSTSQEVRDLTRIGGPFIATLRWVVRIATHPAGVATRLLDEPLRLRYGVIAWLLMGCMYT